MSSSRQSWADCHGRCLRSFSHPPTRSRMITTGWYTRTFVFSLQKTSWCKLNRMDSLRWQWLHTSLCQSLGVGVKQMSSLQTHISLGTFSLSSYVLLLLLPHNYPQSQIYTNYKRRVAVIQTALQLIIGLLLSVYLLYSSSSFASSSLSSSSLSSPLSLC